MRTFRARLQALALATRALNKITRWARDKVNDQSDEAQENYQNYPERGIVHPAGFRILRYPNRQSNGDRKPDQTEDDKKATSATCRAACGRVTTVILGQ